MSLNERELEELIVQLLAHVYRRIPWQKINTSKNAYDVFNHRVRAASRRATLNEFVSKLANYFGLQSVDPEVVELVEELKPYEAKVLTKVYLEHIPISMKAILLAKKMKKEAKS